MCSLIFHVSMTKSKVYCIQTIIALSPNQVAPIVILRGKPSKEPEGRFAGFDRLQVMRMERVGNGICSISKMKIYTRPTKLKVPPVWRHLEFRCNHTNYQRVRITITIVLMQEVFWSIISSQKIQRVKTTLCNKSFLKLMGKESHAMIVNAEIQKSEFKFSSYFL